MPMSFEQEASTATRQAWQQRPEMEGMAVVAEDLLQIFDLRQVLCVLFVEHVELKLEGITNVDAHRRVDDQEVQASLVRRDVGSRPAFITAYLSRVR